MIENICEIKMRGQESIDLIWQVGGFWKLSPGRMRRKGFTVLWLLSHGPHTFNVAHKSFLHLYLIITTGNRGMPLQQGKEKYLFFLHDLRAKLWSLYCSLIVWRHLKFYMKIIMESCMQLCWPHCFITIWKSQLSQHAHEWIVRCRIGAQPQIYPLKWT